MDNRKDAALYAPLVQNDAQASNEALDADTEMDEYGRSRSGVTRYRDEVSRNGVPILASGFQQTPDTPTKKKFSQRRLIISLAPFTIIMALGFIIVAALLGVWVTRAKSNDKAAAACKAADETPCTPTLPNVITPQIALRNNSVGRLPFMGYNTWNSYACDIDENKILRTARLMKTLGFLDIGYDHMNLDDCYSEKQRSASGDIIANKERFPSGMNYLTDQIHTLGLKAGIYSDSGWFTCQKYPGSYMNEDRDIKLFQDWGFDLLKYDNCAVPFDEIIKEGMVGKFTRMSKAIAKLSQESGKPPILFSLCQWGRVQPWIWARRLGQSWRTTMDIYPEWKSLASILNDNSFIADATDFYGRNDMDILEVGNGQLTYEEQKSHFTAWALMKSPLLISTELSTISEETLSILKNKEIIAINQDPVVGTSITPFRWGINPDWSFNATHPAQYWSGESQNGTVIMMLNTLDHPADLSFRLTESPWIRAGRKYFVRDLWTHTDNGTAVRNFTAHSVPAHGVVALLLRDAGDEPAGTFPECAMIDWCIDQNGTRVDGRD